MPSYKKEFDDLNPEQLQAVKQIDGPVLVIAGPGTGKTQLLSVRIAHILDTTDTLPQNILCLTFTDSAVNTMRNRLVGLIGQEAYKVTISTYHGFGSELIRRYPEYFTADMPNVQPTDELATDQILRAILDGLEYANPLKYASSYTGDLRGLVGDFKKALLTPESVEKIADQNQTFMQAANPLIQDCLNGMKRVDKKALPLFDKLAEKTTRWIQATPQEPISQVLPLAQLWQRQLQEALLLAAEDNSTKPITQWKLKWLAKDSQNNFVVSGNDAIGKLRAAAGIYRQYLIEMHSKQLIDYDDMILGAIKGLETHDDLKFSLQEQYQYLLLDEFQDTNQAQLRLVELLCDNPVNEGRPNVLAVGDDDQAVFAFQGADYSHMLAFTQAYRNVLVVPLVQNYRSHAQILQLASGIADQIEERLQDNLPNISKSLTAHAKNMPKQATIERQEFKSDVAQFTWVAKKVAQEIKAGRQPSQIAVLVPKHKFLEPLLPYLEKLNIPISYEKSENILDDPIINELVQMVRLVLALVDNPEQADAIWPEVLSYDFWGLTTAQIWQVSWQAYDKKVPWTNVLMQDSATQPIAEFLVGLSQAQHNLTLELLLDYIIGSLAWKDYKSPFFNYYFGPNKQTTRQFWMLLSNLLVLRQAIRKYRPNQDQPLTAKDLVELIQMYRDANLKVLNTSPYHKDNQSVELMTAFKAKGKEFEVVFVLACSNEAWSAGARGNSSKIGLPENLQFIRYGGATEDERLRLFFVAITRAKTRLYLTNYTNNYAGKQLNRLKYLNEQEVPKEGVNSPLLPEGRQQVVQNDQQTPSSQALESFWQDRHSQANNQVSMQSMLKGRLQNFKLAPTHLNTFTDTVYGGPQNFLLNYLLRFPSSGSPEGHYGIAVHKTLEKVSYYQRQHNKLPDKDELLAMLDQQIRKQRLDKQQTELLIARGHASLWAYIQQKKSSFKPSDVPEFSFKKEGIFVDQAHLSGTIDKLIVDKPNRTIKIIDYKTGKSHSKWSANDIKLYKYQQQLYVYKILVESSTSFANYTVSQAALEFVEPDIAGDIIDLPLIFDQAELERTQQLIKIVWQHIMDLNFPDISGYSSDLKGSRQFQQDLLDGKI